MILEFANTDKKINSTSIVSNYSQTFNGAKFKEESNLTFPIFMIGTNSIAYTDYNYVKVTFSNSQVKYYFINSFELGTNNCWYIRCTMDVLATFRTQILSKTLYVNRSYSDHNKYIPDTRYGAGTHYTINNIEASSSTVVTIKDRQTDITNTDSYYFDKGFSSGYYYIRVVDSASGTGSILYVMDPTGFTDLINKIFRINYGTDFPDIADGVARGVANVFQYITACYWLPCKTSGTLGTETIHLGPYEIETIHCLRINGHKGLEVSFQMSYSHHPERSRGEYLDISPYTSRSLVFYPFGVYDLTMPCITSDNTHINIKIYLDIFTGEAIIKVLNSENALIITDSKNYKVDIPLTETTLSVLGALGGYLAGGSSIGEGNKYTPATFSELIAYTSLDERLGGSMEHFAAGATANRKKGGDLGRLLQSAGTELRTNGTFSAILPYSLKPVIYQTFFYAFAEDLDHNGRPLCENKQLSSLSGYCECEDDDIGIAGASQDQLNMIKNFLTGGFFIE